MYMTYKEKMGQVIVSTVRIHKDFESMSSWIRHVITNKLAEIEADPNIRHQSLRWFKAYKIFPNQSPEILTQEEMIMCGLRE